jgi:hypothetical protein
MANVKDAIINKESDLSDLFSSDFEGIETEGKEGSRVGGDEVRDSKVPGLRVGNSFNSCVAY